MDDVSNSRKVLHQLHSLIKAIDGAGDQILYNEMGLGFSQFKILSAIKERPQSSQAGIAAHLSLTPPAISRHIESLLKKGLVTTSVNPKNRREHLLGLTAAGKNTLKKSWVLFDTRFNSVIQILEDHEQKLLIAMLDRLYYQMLSCKK